MIWRPSAATRLVEAAVTAAEAQLAGAGVSPFFEWPAANPGGERHRWDGAPGGQIVRGRGKFLLPSREAVAIIVFVVMEIMNPSSRLFKLCSVVSCLVMATGSALAAELVLEKVPALTVEQAPGYPENLARYHFGAKVEAAPQDNSASSLQLGSQPGDRNTAEAALLCDDPTIGYALSNGSKSLLITLSKIENIDSISFQNDGAKGEVTVATSNSKLPIDSSDWHLVSKEDLTPAAVKAKIGPGEAKYIKLTFNVTEPGHVAGLGVYATPTVAAFTTPRARKTTADHSGSFAPISYNLADLHARARAVYVSSGEDVRQANNMIDDQSTTTYTFASTDASPTAIIDLGKVTTLHRISALYSPRQGNVDFFVLETLPGTRPGNAPKSLKLDDATLANLKSMGSIAGETGRAAIDFPATSGRYIMAKWTGASQPETPFSVAEIAAFAGQSDNLIVANVSAGSRDRIESDGKTVMDGKDLGSGKDFKDMPEEGPAEGPPPALPEPPPFTFVPELLITSP